MSDHPTTNGGNDGWGGDGNFGGSGGGKWGSSFTSPMGQTVKTNFSYGGSALGGPVGKRGDWDPIQRQAEKVSSALKSAIHEAKNAGRGGTVRKKVGYLMITVKMTAQYLKSPETLTLSEQILSGTIVMTEYARRYNSLQTYRTELEHAYDPDDLNSFISMYSDLMGQGPPPRDIAFGSPKDLGDILRDTIKNMTGGDWTGASK